MGERLNRQGGSKVRGERGFAVGSEGGRKAGPAAKGDWCYAAGPAWLLVERITPLGKMLVNLGRAAGESASALPLPKFFAAR